MAYQGLWWQHGILYQVYPRSFQDTNADGVGDLAGITSRLDYLKWLGVNALWVSPFYVSPMADFGYDVADHTAVDPLFGTLADFDHLLREAHARSLRVIVDYVPNHTSDRHPWFLESRSSRRSPKREWYLWRDAPAGRESPNNWLSTFGGPAWSWDEQTEQYYYHSYLPEQPDLNWRNPQVLEAMLGVLRFWLDRGVDGFRLDAVRKVFKDPQFRDNPPNPEWKPSEPLYRSLLTTYSAGLPELHGLLRQLRSELDRYPNRLLLAESYEPLEKVVTYFGENADECHIPFNFQLVTSPWKARAIEDLIRRYESILPPSGWPNWVLGNHDKPRIAARLGQAQARVAAVLLLTLRGTPTLYQGDELGIGNVSIPPSMVKDPWEKNIPGKGLGRDPSRTPMQWETGPYAGFSTVLPWLPLEEHYCAHCVEVEANDPSSLLSLYRSLIHLRSKEPALAQGAITLLPGQDDVLAYARVHGERRLVAVLNLGNRPQRVGAEVLGTGGRVLVSTDRDREDRAVGSELELRSDEALVIEAS